MNTDTRQGLRNEHVARRRINKAIAETPVGGSIPTPTARLIAATIHGGPDTALSRFAATGELDPNQSVRELDDIAFHQLPPDWWLALDAYLREEADHGRA